MTIFDLQLKAELENVTNLAPKEDEEEAYTWFIKFQCCGCRETTENFVSVNIKESRAISGSRGDAHLVMTCKFCKRENSASLCGPAAAYATSDQYATIVQIECRGIDPVEFSPRGDWRAASTVSDAKFEFSLDEDEWYDYDDEAGETVSVTKIEARFERGRAKK